MTEGLCQAMISVLVPVRGEADDIFAIHRAVSEKLADQRRPFEFLFLIDRVSLQAKDLRKLQKDDPEHVRVLEFEYVVGEAAMLRAGAEVARGELILTLPCPLEVEPDAIGALCERVEAGVDMVVVTRMATASSRLAVAQSRLFNRLISLAAGMQVRDVASGTRLLRREVLDEIPLYGDFHRYLPILARRTGFRVEEVAVPPHPQSQRTSIHAPSTYLWRLIDVINVLFISRFTRRPLRLFGSLGSVFLALGLPIMALVGVQRLLGTPLGNRPILVLGTLLVGLGVQAFTIGLLGELLLFFNARSFRDYRIAEIWESDRSLEPLSDAPDSTHEPVSEAPPRESSATSLPRTSDTRPRG
jgi:hypothetical protein